MRVALVTTSFPLEISGSSGIFVARLVEALARRVRIEVVVPSATAPGRTAWRDTPIHAFRYAPWRYQLLAHAQGGVPVALRRRPWLRLLLPVFLLSMFWACLRRGRNADLLHANWAPTGVVAGCAGWLLRIPVVTTIRGEDAQRLADSSLQRLLMRACVALNRQIVCVSEGLLRDIAERFPSHAGKFRFVGNGVGSDFSECGTGDGDTRGRLVLLVVGSLIPRKNVGLALRAMARLPIELQSGVVLRMVGDGPERAALEREAAALGLGDAVEFRGAVDPERVPAQLASGAALLLCSHSEGRPNVVLEAMAAGLPIVASDIVGLRELVRPDIEGLLFAVNDESALVCQLARLLSDRKLRLRLAHAARQRIAELGLSWDAAADGYLRIYAAAMAREG